MFGFSMSVIWIIYNAYYFHPSNFEWRTSLPLHVCDLLGPISSIALITSNKNARALLYFCAIPFAAQAIITPTGNQDPNTLRFWLYWLLHAGIISSSIFDLTLRGYRPTQKDFVRVLFVDTLYVVMITPFNILFDWNYGYLGASKPDTPTDLDLLGPWPERIGVMLLVAALLQCLMYLPWFIRDGLLNSGY